MRKRIGVNCMKVRNTNCAEEFKQDICFFLKSYCSVPLDMRIKIDRGCIDYETGKGSQRTDVLFADCGDVFVCQVMGQPGYDCNRQEHSFTTQQHCDH